MAKINVGDTIYHARRYWKMDNLRPDEEVGWNAVYLPFTVTRLTDKTIFAERQDSKGVFIRVQLSRAPREPKPQHARPTRLETDGKQYHSRFHEYFYVEIPKRSSHYIRLPPDAPQAFAVLGVTYPCSRDEVKRAYKRLARKHHPDVGGSHDKFLELKGAYDAALRLC